LLLVLLSVPYTTLLRSWEYDRGKFDAIIWREKGETIYLRIPFHVINGELDKSDAYIQFRTPYIIKHVVNLGLDRNENSLLSATGDRKSTRLNYSHVSIS